MIDENQLVEETGIIVGETKVELSEDKAATECMADLVLFLIRNNHLDESDFPIKSGPKRYLINTEPVHQSGKEMVRPKNVEGYYLECNYSVDSIKNKIFDILQIAGFQPLNDNEN